MLTTIYLIGIPDIKDFEEKLFIALAFIDSAILGIVTGAILAAVF
jgi:hypothetical protein